MAFSSQVQVRPFGVPPDPQAHAVHVMRPSRNLVQDRWVLRLLAQSRAFLPPFTQRGRDDTIVMIHDRKVRLSDGASLYAPCRSWVRNGLPQETQDADSVEPVSPQKLLQRHIKHAKRVRAREERLQWIARYKQRLALLLPPPVGWLRNDATPAS